jgi:hypothetical protein
MCTVSGKFSETVQLLKALVPVLATSTSSWKLVPLLFVILALQLCAASACPAGAITITTDSASDKMATL